MHHPEQETFEQTIGITTVMQPLFASGNMKRYALQRAGYFSEPIIFFAL